MKMNNRIPFIVSLFILILSGQTVLAGQSKAPVILAMNPKFGPPGTEVTLLGKNFHPSYSVFLGSIKLQAKVRTAAQMKVLIPKNAKTGHFSIKGPGGQIKSRLIFKITRPTGPGTAAPPPIARGYKPVQIQSFEPQAGYMSQIIKISGNNFNPVATENIVTLGGVPVKVVSSTKTSIDVILDRDSVTGYFQIETKEGGRAVFTDKLFHIVKEIAFTSMKPLQGIPSTYVVVKGDGFDHPQLKVTIGATSIPVRVVSPKEIHMSIPDGTKSGPVTISTPNAGSVSSSQSFAVLDAVIVRDFQPRFGYVGQKISIYGTGFEANAAANIVTLNDKRVRVTSASAKKLRIEIPNGATSGKLRVQVPGRNSFDVEGNFLVTEKVVIASFSPDTGAPGSKVKITGSGFKNAGLMGFIGQTPVPLEASSKTAATITVPKSARGGNIIIVAPGAGRAQSPNRYTVKAPEQEVVSTRTTTKEAESEIPELAAQPSDMDTLLGVGDPTGDTETILDSETVPVKEKEKVEEPELVDIPVKEKVEELDPSVLRITSVEPASAAPGDFVEIYGTGFGEDPDAIKIWLGNISVKAEGVVPDMVIFEVPKNARKGRIKIKVDKKKPVKSSSVLKITK